MGNQVYALGSLPGEPPLLFLAGAKTRPVYAKGGNREEYPPLEDDPETYQAQ